MIRIIIFAAGSIFLLLISLRQLKNPGVHGFYRFFSFEGILALVLLNHPFWFSDPFSPLHLFSWGLLAGSIYTIIAALRMLRRHGSRQEREAMPENFVFENTKYLVDKGIYRYIRHPMYTSLLLLGWGAFCKHPTWLNTVIIVGVTIFMLVCAKVEEQENIAFFGEEYVRYMQKSKKFIPLLL